jgi:hypothetical protein
MKEYPMSRANKTFCYIFMPVCYAGAIFLFYKAATSVSVAPMSGWLLLGLLAAFLGFYVFREAKVMLVTLDDDSLTQRTVFSTRSILLKELDGYRTGEKDAFVLVPKDGGKSLQLTKSIADRKELIGWVRENYPDIEAREREVDEAVLLEDDRFGATRTEREEALAKARQLARITTIAGYALLLWEIFYPKPYELVMFLSFLAPWVALFLVWRYKGLIRLYSTKSSAHPAVGNLLALPVFGAGLRTLINYDLYGFPQSAWLGLLAGTVLLALVALRATREAMAAEKNKAFVTIGIILLAGAYSYGGMVYANCHYDKSAAQVWPVSVTDKRISHGKSTSYYVTVSPWGKYTDGKEVSVGKSFYTSVSRQDTLSVVLRQGKLGIPWYYLVSH